MNSEQKQLLNDIFDQIPTMFHSIDKDGKIIRVSDYWLEVLKYTREEVIGKRSTDFMTEESRKYAIEVTLPKYFQTGKCMNVPYQMVKKSGEVLDVLLSGSSLYDEEGKFVQSLATLTDVTTQKKIEQELRKNEEKYRLLVENSSDLIIKLGIDRRIIFVSSSFCEKFDIAEEELLGTMFTLEMSDKDTLDTKKALDSLRFPPYNCHIEIRSLTKKGWKWLAWSFSAMLDDQFNVVAFVGVGRDITTSKEADIALRESEKRFRGIAETSITGIISTDENENILYVNKASAEMMGYPVNQLIGSNLKNLVPKEEFERYQNETRIRKKGLHSIYETKLYRKNGKVIYAMVSASPILDEDGTFRESMGVLVNITQLKETENKLKEADKLKTAFLANMSHEIRNPMNGIIGFADLLRFPNLLEEEKNEYIDLINSSCNLLLRLIEDIIDISKIEAGQLVIKKTECYLNTVIMELCTMYNEKKNQIDKAHIELNFTTENPSSDFKIITDSYRLRQILSNLIENAFKFTKQGKITFGYSIKNSTLLFYVKDTGIGIPAEKLNIIFDRFRQVDEDTAIRKYSGAGLGLSISKSLSELLGGQMSVESVVNEGTTFYFTLPMEVSKTGISESLAGFVFMEDLDWSDKTILIAEDEKTNYIFLERVLKKTKAKLIWHTDGKETIKECRDNPLIDLLLLDIKMPKVSGYKVITEVRKFRKDLPIVVHTAYAMVEEKEKCLKLGCDDYLTKPIKSDQLLLILCNYFV